MALYSDLLHSVASLHEDSLTWNADNIELTVATSLDDDTVQTINFSSTLGHNTRRSKHLDPESVYWLQKSYGKNSPEFRAQTLLPFFQKACSKEGFKVHNKGWEKKLGCVRIACPHSRFYQHDN